jgi:sortase A
VLPGQEGSSVVMGRKGTYGGPFGSIYTLKVGDVITTTTGQGKATYEVSGVRYEGDPQPLAPDDGTGRLTLVSASGPAFVTTGIVRVDATLTSKPFETPLPALLVGSLTSAEAPLASDDSGWLPLLLILELAAVAVLVFTILVRRWGRWHTWVVATPVALVLGCTIAEQVIVLFPNLY